MTFYMVRGSDYLDGGMGRNRMHGGADNDTYIVNSVNDIVNEKSNENIDAVISSISYSLPANVENLTLTGTDDLNATGNSLRNTIIGNSGNNIITDLTLNDSDILIGGNGDDTYIVDVFSLATPIIIELVGVGNDTLIAKGGNLNLPENVENLIYTGTLNISLLGNELDNYLQGGPGADAISGFVGTNTMVRGSGNDTLNGGRGNDTYTSFTGAAFRNDIINDLSGSADILDLSNFSPSLIAGSNPFTRLAAGGGSGLDLRFAVPQGCSHHSGLIDTIILGNDPVVDFAQILTLV
ncbi:MAG: hypothetical protein SFT81_06090 [Candidatus Caenarcaniphilales bacterium]|nr:hypothetical protein [Candidatus Caenarcaniphilales bacterium]